mgnify:FL=1
MFMLIIMTCKKICLDHKAENFGKNRYLNNQKRCQICEIFIEWEGTWCPCCGYMLRTHPRNSKSRKKFDILKSRH